MEYTDIDKVLDEFEAQEARASAESVDFSDRHVDLGCPVAVAPEVEEILKELVNGVCLIIGCWTAVNHRSCCWRSTPSSSDREEQISVDVCFSRDSGYCDNEHREVLWAATAYPKDVANIIVKTEPLFNEVMSAFFGSSPHNLLGHPVVSDEQPAGIEHMPLKARLAANKCLMTASASDRSQKPCGERALLDTTDDYTQVLRHRIESVINTEPTTLCMASIKTGDSDPDSTTPRANTTAATAVAPGLIEEETGHDESLVTVITGEHSQGLRLTESEMMLGKVAPVWISDRDSDVCMICEVRFTIIKRRHHCRACGRVLCSDCCSTKARLRYMENKLARVCIPCAQKIERINEMQTISSDSAPVSFGGRGVVSAAGDAARSEASSRVPVGVLKRPGSGRQDAKAVVFVDGLKPGEAMPSSQPRGSPRSTRSQRTFPERPVIKAARDYRSREKESFIPSTIGQYPSASLINGSVLTEAASIFDALVKQDLYVTFQVKRNLRIRVKLIRDSWNAWCFCSQGLINTGCSEVTFLLRRHDNESLFPVAFLSLFDKLYHCCLEGQNVSSMTYLPFAEISRDDAFLEAVSTGDNAGLLFVSTPSYLVRSVRMTESCQLLALLVKKSESPWAQVLPMRLLLRFGYEYNCYPWPAVSDAERNCVFYQLGHTVMSLLNDFRNYSYSISRVAGCYVNLTESALVMSFDARSCEQLKRIFDCNDEHVVAWSADFSPTADSFLVCVEDEEEPVDGASYRSQKLLKAGTPGNETGCVFVILNASLKSATDPLEVRIIEDGIVIEVTLDAMEQIQEKILDRKDFVLQQPVGCSLEGCHSLRVQWRPGVSNDLERIFSPVDGIKLSNVVPFAFTGQRVEKARDNELLRLVQVYVLHSSSGTPSDLPPRFSALVRKIGSAVEAALINFAQELYDADLKVVGVRVRVASDEIEYKCGSGGKPLPDAMLPAMDDVLIPLLQVKLGDYCSTWSAEFVFAVIHV